jgi:hypothetical protein
MWTKSFLLALIVAAVSTPALAQDAFNSTADTGKEGGFSNGKTKGNFNGGGQKTSKQNDKGLQLPGTTTSAPTKGGGSCPGNFALKQLGGSSLPPTKLNGLVKDGGEAVFGGDGELLPKYFTFDESHRMERAMEKNPKLTTNHKLGSPSAWDFPE